LLPTEDVQDETGVGIGVIGLVERGEEEGGGGKEGLEGKEEGGERKRERGREGAM